MPGITLLERLWYGVKMTRKWYKTNCV
jgi:hypothetical protein